MTPRFHQAAARCAAIQAAPALSYEHDLQRGITRIWFANRQIGLAWPNPADAAWWDVRAADGEHTTIRGDHTRCGEWLLGRMTVGERVP